MFEPYLRQFAAYYYNRGEEWQQGVVINYKHEAFPEGTAVLDVERGQLTDIRPLYWQTDTSVSQSSWGYITHQEYRTADALIDDLVDIVSKNGNLLLNIGPRPDGTIPEPEQAILLEMGKWLAVNGEAILRSPLTASHLPISNKIACSGSGMVPSGRGPMFRSKFPFLLTMSTRSSISASAVRYSVGDIAPRTLRDRRIRLPIERANPGELSAFHIEHGRPFGKCLVLVIDDHPLLPFLGAIVIVGSELSQVRFKHTLVNPPIKIDQLRLIFVHDFGVRAYQSSRNSRRRWRLRIAVA